MIPEGYKLKLLLLLLCANMQHFGPTFDIFYMYYQQRRANLPAKAVHLVLPDEVLIVMHVWWTASFQTDFFSRHRFA